MPDSDFDPQVMYVDGFDDLRKAFDQAPQFAIPIVVKAMDRAALAIIGEVKTYPPATAANAPGRMHIVKHSSMAYGAFRGIGEFKNGSYSRYIGGQTTPREEPMGYYQRGTGWWYPIQKLGGRIEFLMVRHEIKGLFGRSTGLKLAKNVAGVAGYKLSKKHTSEELGQSWTHTTERTETEIVTTIGNNASYVDYVNGRYQPALFHMRGWETIDEAMEKVVPDVDAIFSDAADEIVAAIAKR
jgi:hypothetical protein